MGTTAVEEVGAVADGVLIGTRSLTYSFADLLPAPTQVYGGVARAYFE